MFDSLCYQRQPASWQQRTAETQFTCPTFARGNRQTPRSLERFGMTRRRWRLQAPVHRGSVAIDRRFSAAHATAGIRQQRSSDRHLTVAGAQPEYQDLLVTDDFAASAPITAAELNVIETYLDDVLRELLPSTRSEELNSAS